MSNLTTVTGNGEQILTTNKRMYVQKWIRNSQPWWKFWTSHFDLKCIGYFDYTPYD